MVSMNDVPNGPIMSGAPKKTNTMAMVSIILAGVSLLSSPAICIGLPIILSLAGLITGVIGLNQIKKYPDKWTGKEIAFIGAIINGSVIFLWIVVFIILLILNLLL